MRRTAMVQNLGSKDQIKGIVRQVKLFGIQRHMLGSGSGLAGSQPLHVGGKIRIYDILESRLPKDLFVLRASPNDQHALIRGHAARRYLSSQYPKELGSGLGCHRLRCRIRRRAGHWFHPNSRIEREESAKNRLLQRPSRRAPPGQAEEKRSAGA